MAIKEFSSIASDARKLIEAPEYYKRELKIAKDFRKLVDEVTPLLVLYRLNYLKPLFYEIRNDFFKVARSEIPLVEPGSLIAFDPNTLTKMMQIIILTLSLGIRSRYSEMLEGSRRIWMILQKLRKQREK